jgi:misacylated tRNA(Ala) deacylase
MSAFLTGPDLARHRPALWPLWSQHWLTPHRPSHLPQDLASMTETLIPPTEDLFRADAYQTEADAVVLAVAETEKGVEILLNRTLFYPTGGGQPGDTGVIVSPSGAETQIMDTRKGPIPNTIVHLADAAPAFCVGDAVTLRLDWLRRHRLMRMHTCLHLLSSVIPAGVTGGQVSEDKGRLDFDIGELVLDKDAIETHLNALIAADHRVGQRWITDAELEANPGLVKTMSVQPPRGAGRVRLIDIPGVDLQPCGGTHVARTGEIGPVRIDKIESKGKRNRRVVLAFANA